MPACLVTPELKVYRFADRSALIAFTKSRQLERHLAANLRQLLGFDEVGEDRTTRRAAAGWYNLRDVKFVLNTTTRLLVPLVGTVDDKLKQMQQHEPDIDDGAAETAERVRLQSKAGDRDA